MSISRLFSIGVLALVAVTPAFAQNYRLMLQNRDTSLSPPNESFVWNYNSFGNMTNHVGSAAAWQANVDAAYQSTDFEFDGQYRSILQNRSTAGSPPTETYIWTYNTYNDMINHNGSAVSMSINVAGDFVTTGLIYDGQYRLFLQNRSTAVSPPNETFIWTYNTFNDLVNHNGTFVSWQANVDVDFVMTGATYDGQYRVALQNRSTATSPPNETYFWTYNSFADMVAHNGTFTSWSADVAPDFRMVGLAYEPVPEPATLAVAAGGLLLIRRRRRSR